MRIRGLTTTHASRFVGAYSHIQHISLKKTLPQTIKKPAIGGMVINLIILRERIAALTEAKKRE